MPAPYLLVEKSNSQWKAVHINLSLLSVIQLDIGFTTSHRSVENLFLSAKSNDRQKQSKRMGSLALDSS